MEIYLLKRARGCRGGTEKKRQITHRLKTNEETVEGKA